MARIPTSVGSGQRAGRDPPRPTLGIASTACSSLVRNVPPSSSRPSPDDRDKSTLSSSFGPSCTKAKRSKKEEEDLRRDGFNLEGMGARQLDNSEWLMQSPRPRGRGDEFLLLDTHTYIKQCLYAPVRNGPEDPLHHGKMLPIIVSLKQRHAQVELKQYATNRPDIARLRPAQFCVNQGEEKKRGKERKR